MYSRSEASNIKKEFWTTFGLYMKPIKNAEGADINWVNYKTGIRHIYFRMDATKRDATIAIELKHPSSEDRNKIFEKFEVLKNYFNQIIEEQWTWQLQFYDEDGSPASRIFTQLEEVNIYKKESWPMIISFLKERIIKLDLFWNDVKIQFEN
ncbi:DUF4268 domain-containing protein [Niabella ginsengisoli]|uniref:DUF4268 domain-containing protein n=1 Tax=Niabella ginsengisoli TaxID=522298 RepID=A0ABS9SHC8_9BACT|nr:DUF4268 domain-containing protein [Niabella ginsengisoli]MCH5597772.1 DUF4268 domain-containing protein [Niabella ginsengisoli]